MSNRRKIQEQIGSSLETCVEQYEHITTHDGKIPQIELDIIMGNIRNLYEQFTLLNKLNSSHGKDPLTSDEVIDKPEVHAPYRENNMSAVQPTKEEIKDERVKEEKTSHSVSGTNISVETEKTPQQEKSDHSNMEGIAQKNKSTATANLFDQNADDEDNDMPTINEKIHKNKLSESSLADKLKQNRINDLKHAIGINEKFLFINELFEGSLNEYNKAITQLNTYTSKDEAEKYIEGELKLKYKWSDTSKAQSVFIELIERKFL